MKRLLPAALGALFALLVVTPAQADEAAIARFHHRRAARFYEAGNYERAVEEFFRVQQLAPSPRTPFNIAQCFLRLRRHEDAFLFFSEYLANEDDAEGAEERRSYAERTIRERLEPRVARVRVVSEPANGQIFVDDVEHGSYGRTPRVLALEPGPHRIMVALGGHVTASAEVELERGSLAEVQLEPHAILGELRLRASRAAQVVVRDTDGEVIAEGAAEGPETPYSLPLPPGGYVIAVSTEGFRDFQRWITIGANETTDIEAPLERAEAGGSVTVTANVPGALVEREGEPAGFAPLRITGLRPGPVRFRLRAPGRLEWSEEVRVEDGELSYLTVSLDLTPSGPDASTWWVGAFGAGGLIAGLALGGAALYQGDRFRSQYAAIGGGGEDLRALRDEIFGLNVGADVLMAAGGLALVVAVVLYFATDDRGRRESSAIFSPGGGT